MARRPTTTRPEGHRTTPLAPVGDDASSAAVAVVVVLTGPQLGERVVLDAPVEIGRSADAALRLSDPDVGLLHVSIEPTSRSDRWRVKDLGVGATAVSGRELTPESACEVGPRDEIRVGDTLLRVELHGEIEQEFGRVVVERLHKDDLTGLLSRRKFEDELAARLELEGPLTLALLDIDGLKRVNDSHGHLAGAAVIAHVGRTIARTLGSRGIAARLGGDEIAVLFPLSLEEAREVSEGLLDAVRFDPCVHEDYRHAITISAGLSARLADADLIMRAADAALLEAKRRGGDCLVVS